MYIWLQVYIYIFQRFYVIVTTSIDMVVIVFILTWEW